MGEIALPTSLLWPALANAKDQPASALLCAPNTSPDLHHDLALGAAFFEIGERFLRLIERKYLVYHGSDFFRLEQFADLRELATVGMHEQK